MRVIRAGNYEELSRVAAGIIAAHVIKKPDSVLGLATGDSPLGLYKYLANWFGTGFIDFSEASAINLDEYRGVAPDNTQSYRYFMETNLFSKINIKPENRHIPDGLAKDSNMECARYDSVIESTGGIDLQLLGIGHNGHIGFNEPGSEFVMATHVVDLSDDTINANSRFFENPGDVPVQAYTMGIRAIIQSRAILLIIAGKQKAGIVKRALYGSVSPDVPASILQLHNNLTVVGDNDALSMI